MKLEEAIKNIKRICEYLKESDYMSIDKDTKISLETVLTHLTKQEKIIQKLEARKYMFNAETGEITQIPVDNNYISKDKIKGKIEEYEKHCSKCEFIHLNLCEHCFYRDRIRLINELLKE